MTETITKRKTIAQLIAENAENLVPVDGDRAYTFYHGVIWEGILREIPWNGREGWGGCFVIIPADGKQMFDHYEGYYKFFEKLPTANVTVYSPSLMNLEDEDNWHEQIKKMGYETPNRMVAYDTNRGMFYLRACED
jgi:hypothetical protein